MYNNLTYEKQIADLYKEFNEKKEKGENPDREIYKRRKRFLELAIEMRDKNI